MVSRLEVKAKIVVDDSSICHLLNLMLDIMLNILYIEQS